MSTILGVTQAAICREEIAGVQIEARGRARQIAA
jgi:hypothetical protein